MRKTRTGGGVVVNNKGLILVVSQHGTSWSLPKGHVDEGEEEIDAAKREIYEESGIRDLELVKELGTYKRYMIGKDGKEDTSELKTITIFLFKTREEYLNPIDEENPEALWLEKDKVADLLTHLKDKEFFLSIKDQVC